MPDHRSFLITAPGHRSGRFAFGLPALAVLLVVAYAIGGGGSRFGLANLAVQLTALTIMALRPASCARFWREAPLALRIMIAASLALPLLQIVPLPEAVWMALPGHELASRALEVTGQPGGWMPWSLDPLRTLLAATALITPLAVLMAGWDLPRHQLFTLGWLVVALGIITTVLGTLQLNPTGEAATIFGAREPGSYLLGTFANRNSTGLLLGFSLALAALLPAPRPHPAVVPLRLALCALLVVTIILTKSRTAVVLALIPVGLGMIRALWWTAKRRRSAGQPGTRPGLAIAGAIALVAVGAAALAVTAPGRVGETIERFEAKNDPRRFLWEDAAYATERYWPAGAGMGTFDAVFQVDESLENVTLRTAGRAHNDYLELAIEAGLPGLALAALWLLLCAVLTWQARRSSMAWAGWAGSAFLFAIALQSITDYPLRNQTILAFGAFALLLLARTAADEPRRGA